MDVSRVGLLSMAAGVACVRAVRKLSGLDVRLKWPNDVMVGGRKLAGILAESRVTGGTVDVAVIGMGVNLDLPFDDLPPEVADRATSLARELGAAPPQPGSLLSAIVEELDPLYRQVLAGDPAVIDAANELCETLGKEVVIRFPDGSSEEGRAVLIAPDGRLEVSVGGETRFVDVAEIEQLRER
jgi:BirA family biotin operon repressor/biotin-[acetyl-CoA-carboxylase] ligase